LSIILLTLTVLVVAFFARYLLIEAFGPKTSPLVLRNEPAVPVSWPDGRSTVGVSWALPPKLVTNQSYALSAHVTFMAVGQDTVAPELPGGGYDISITATMASAAFEVKQGSEERQTAMGPLMTWTWLVLPKAKGQQPINLAINVEYRSKKSGNVVSTASLYRRTRTITVEEPLLKISQIDPLALIIGIATGLIGGALKKKLIDRQ
jgi:hypothetical protein